MDLIRFRLADVGDLPTCGGRRRAKGEKASPLAIPGLYAHCRLILAYRQASVTISDGTSLCQR